MSARDNILARIRANAGRGGTTGEAERAEVRAAIAARARGPLPAFARGDVLTRFKGECTRLGTTVDEIDDQQGIPLAVARYLEQNRLERRLVAWVSLSALDWRSVGIECESRPAEGGDLVGLTDCFCAIGETGTLLLLSAPDTPKLTALLPETHLCVVSRSRIVAAMEDAFALIRSECGRLPRAAFFVSGPSRTADIEQTIVIGAHGPYRVHVILTP